MEKPIYETCHYLRVGQCPHQSRIEKTLLIPQLLDSSEVDDILEECKSCGNYLKEKRKYLRITRPIRCDISRDNQPTIEGHIVDISRNGALIKVNHGFDFDSDEKVRLVIHSADEPMVKDFRTIEVLTQIKRLAMDKKQLGVLFLSKSNA